MVIGVLFFFFWASKILSRVCSSQVLLQVSLEGISSLYAEYVQICAVDCVTKVKIIFKSLEDLYFLHIYIYTKGVSKFLICFLAQKDAYHAGDTQFLDWREAELSW